MGMRPAGVPLSQNAGGEPGGGLYSLQESDLYGLFRGTRAHRGLHGPARHVRTPSLFLFVSL
eukprot:7419434-Pyramimonas_sp.AAC.1